MCTATCCSSCCLVLTVPVLSCASMHACRGFDTLPIAQPLPNLTLQQVLLNPDAGSSSSSAQSATSSTSSTSSNTYASSSHTSQQLLNTCSSEALSELLRHLKRAYWPFPWDTNLDCFDRGGRGSTGGFRCGPEPDSHRACTLGIKGVHASRACESWVSRVSCVTNTGFGRPGCYKSAKPGVLPPTKLAICAHCGLLAAAPNSRVIRVWLLL